MAQTSPVIPEQIRYWDTGAPPYRWIEMISARLRDGRLPVSITSFRGYALLAVAMHDASIAAWHSKYAYNRPGPSAFDPSVQPVIAAAPSPSYPSEHATAAGAAATVLAYLFPDEAELSMILPRKQDGPGYLPGFTTQVRCWWVSS
jgi:membrane-associated phospholipid phosphatase